MSFESDLQTLLLVRCPRVFQGVPTTLPARPYVTWAEIGGKTLRALDNVALDKRNALLQVNVWADKHADARALIRQIEDDLCASAAFVAEPQGEAVDVYEEETKLCGSLQRHSVYAART